VTPAIRTLIAEVRLALAVLLIEFVAMVAPARHPEGRIILEGIRDIAEAHLKHLESRDSTD